MIRTEKKFHINLEKGCASPESQGNMQDMSIIQSQTLVHISVYSPYQRLAHDSTNIQPYNESVERLLFILTRTFG